MNAVWNSYGQLCGCPEIFKKSCKFFCRELDIRVPQIVKAHLFHAVPLDIVCLRVNTKAHSFCCSSSPQKVL